MKPTLQLKLWGVQISATGHLAIWLSFLLALALLAVLTIASSPAYAAESKKGKPKPAEVSQKHPRDTIRADCSQYGTGFVPLPGSSGTCVRSGGRLEVGVGINPRGGR